MGDKTFTAIRVFFKHRELFCCIFEILEGNHLAEDRAIYAYLETAYRGFCPTTGHYGSTAVMLKMEIRLISLCLHVRDNTSVVGFFLELLRKMGKLWKSQTLFVPRASEHICLRLHFTPALITLLFPSALLYYDSEA